MNFRIIETEKYEKILSFERYKNIQYQPLPFPGFFGAVGIVEPRMRGMLGPDTILIEKTLAEAILNSLQERQLK